MSLSCGYHGREARRPACIQHAKPLTFMLRVSHFYGGSILKFHIITAMYNVEDWIEENVQLLKDQTFSNFQIVLIDDQSTDNTIKLVRAAIQGDSRFRLIVNQEKKFKTRNVVEAIEAANPDDEDVIVLVDGDDRLAHKDVLRKLESIYQQKKCWMTYGSFADSQGVRNKGCRPYKKDIIINNRFRQSKWIAYHLKTFKYKLWKALNMDIFQITEKEVKRALALALLKLQFRRWYHWKDIRTEDLHDVSGKYIKRVDDKAFSYPMLEMSGEKACFINEVMYIFRSERMPYQGPDQNYGKNKSEKWHTRLIREILTQKKPYTRLDQL
jgi:glycosyltransferase involved in cell wall biosynthesis